MEADSKVKTPWMEYKVRLLPWGETCSQSEMRLDGLNLRALWRERCGELQKQGVEQYESYYCAHLDFSPDKVTELLENDPKLSLNADDARFINECRSGLRLSRPLRAGIEKELDWIGGNLNQALPELRTAPSLWAINFIMDARVNNKVRENFWATCWSKRLSPGDKKPKASALKEDRVETEGEWGEQHLEDLKKRMRGE